MSPENSRPASPSLIVNTDPEPADLQYTIGFSVPLIHQLRYLATSLSHLLPFDISSNHLPLYSSLSIPSISSILFHISQESFFALLQTLICPYSYFLSELDVLLALLISLGAAPSLFLFLLLSLSCSRKRLSTGTGTVLLAHLATFLFCSCIFSIS